MSSLGKARENAREQVETEISYEVVMKREKSSTTPKRNSKRGSPKKKSRKKKKGPTDADRLMAEELAQNEQKLKDKLTDEIFLEACNMSGILPSELKPKSLSSFRQLPGRAKILSKAEQHMRYEAFEKNRGELLLQVVTQEQSSIEKRQLDAQREKKRNDKLGSTFQSKLAREQQQLERMRIARSKYEKVLETENNEIMKGVANSEEALQDGEARVRQIKRLKDEVKNNIKARAAKRQQQIAARVQARKDEEENWKRVQKLRMEAKEKNAARQLEAKRGAKSVRARRLKEQEMHRQERRKVAREAEAAKRQQQLSSMQRKGGNAEKMQARKRAERERKKVERQLQSDLRQQKAERVRKAKAYEKQKLVDKMNANYERMEAMKEMKAAIELERREMNRKEWIRRAKWKEKTAVERSVTPGPGAYKQPSTLANSGGSWGKFKPKSDLDLIIARANETPAPGEYGVGTGSTLKVNGGTWGKFSGKSDLEERMYRAAQTPGPGEYRPKVDRGKEGVAFSSFTPKSELDIAILRAAESPAPGQYDGDIIPKRKKKLSELTKEFKVTNKAVLFAAKLRGKLNKNRSRSTGSAK